MLPRAGSTPASPGERAAAGVLGEVVSEGVFRTNPRLEIVPYERLGPAEQAALGELAQEAGHFGILRSRDHEGTIRAIDCDLALLLQSLREPGPVPRFARRALGDGLPQRIAEFVLDGVLEVNLGGRFVGGPDAWRSLTSEGAVRGQGRIQILSWRAVEWVARLGLRDQAMVAARLYFAGRIPASASWRARWPDPEAVLGQLGLLAGDGGAVLAALGWRLVAAQSPDKAWAILASNRSRPRASPSDSTGAKLYVSVWPSAIADAFVEVLATPAMTRAHRLKVGRDVHGLLRPDKLVAYFDSLDDLLEAADQLASRLDGLPTHGVPFTSELAGDGLLSCGMDPPRGHRAATWPAAWSWRLWLVHRLAAALITAGDGGALTPEEAARFALARLSLQGIDTHDWIPAGLKWPEGRR